MTKPIFKLWPDPEEGKPYGPTAKQKMLFIEDLPLEDTWVDISTGAASAPEAANAINIKRPHRHPVDCVLYIGGARQWQNL